MLIYVEKSTTKSGLNKKKYGSSLLVTNLVYKQTFWGVITPLHVYNINTGRE